MSMGGSTKTERDSTSTHSNTATESSSVQRDKLDIKDEAVDKILEDLLSSAGGLADIFSGEKSAGLYNSTTAADQAGDLTSKIVGEIAKLTAERVVTKDDAENVKSSTFGRKETYAAEVEGKYGF